MNLKLIGENNCQKYHQLGSTVLGFSVYYYYENLGRDFVLLAHNRKSCKFTGSTYKAKSLVFFLIKQLCNLFFFVLFLSATRRINHLSISLYDVVNKFFIRTLLLSIVFAKLRM